MIETIDAEKCTGCGICVDVCPLDTLRLNPFTAESPPCRQACPAGVDVRGIVYHLKQDMIEEAVGLLHQELPYPSITGRLCSYPCENACARKKVDEPVNIHTLERFAGDFILAHEQGHLPVLHASKIAIIGSGPTGMAAAFYLRRMGYRATIFEKEDLFGGSFLREVSDNRLEGEILDAEIDRLRRFGIAFQNKTCLSRDLGFKELRDMGYRAILLATGVASDASSVGGSGLPEEEAEGVFADTALITKEMPMIKAVALAKGTASRIGRYLQNPLPGADQRTKAKNARNIPRKGITSKPRHEAINGFDEHTARQESFRCMSCGSLALIAYPEDCMTCFECEVECPVDAIKVHPFKEILPLTLALE